MFQEEIQAFVPMEMGRRIQDARHKKGIKSIDMAIRLDISKNQYARIEGGESICTTKILHKIAQFLEVSTDYLLYGNIEDEYLSMIRILLKDKPIKEIEKISKVIQIMVSE